MDYDDDGGWRRGLYQGGEENRKRMRGGGGGSGEGEEG